MADTTLEILIKARNQAEKTLRDLQRQIGDVQKSLGATSGKGFKEAETAAKGAGRAAQDASRKTRQAAESTKELANRGKEAGSAFRGLGQTLAGLGAGLGIATLLRGTVDFERAVGEVSTLVDDTDRNVNQLREDVLTLSDTFNAAPVDTARALYQAISAGAAAGEEANELLTVALKTSIGGVTDVATAVNGLTTVLNAWNKDTSEAEAVADVLFTTMRNGKTTIGELSQFLFVAAPTAAALGISFEELSAAITAMTLQGTPTRVAFTGIRQAMASILRPSKELEDAFFGVAGQSAQTVLRTQGLKAALDVIIEASGGSTASLLTMVGSIEGVQAILQLTANEGKSFAEQIDNTANSAGAANEAFEKMEENIARDFDRAANNLQITFRRLGEALRPVFTILLDVISDVGGAIANFIRNNQEGVKTFATVLSGLIAAFTAFSAIRIVATLTGITGAFRAATAAASGFAFQILRLNAGLLAGVAGFSLGSIIAEFDIAGLKVREWGALVIAQFDEAFNGGLLIAKTAWAAIKNTVQQGILFIRGASDEEKRIRDAALERELTEIKAQFEARKKVNQDVISSLRAQQEEARKRASASTQEAVKEDTENESKLRSEAKKKEIEDAAQDERDRVQNQRRAREREFPRLLAQLQGENERLTAIEKERIDLLKDQLDDGLVSIEQYYRAREEAARAGTDRERAILEANIENLKRQAEELAIIEGTQSSNIVQIQTQIAEQEEKLKTLSETSSIELSALARERTNAYEKLNDQLRDVRISLAQALGGVGSEEDIEASIRDRFTALAGSLSQLGVGQDVIDQLINVEVARERIGQLQDVIGVGLDVLANKEEEIRQRQQAGSITTIQADNEIAAAKRLTAAEMENQVILLEQIAARSGSPELVAQAQAARLEFESLNNALSDTAITINASVKGAAKGFFVDILEGTKSAKDAFADFATSILNTLNDLIAQQLVEELFGSILGSSGGSGDGFNLGSFLGGIFGFKEGGLVNGPGTGTSDSIPARLSAGEYVVPAKQTKDYLPVLEAMRQGKFNSWADGKSISLRMPSMPRFPYRFAEGGLVPGGGNGATSVGGTNVRIVNVVDPSLAVDAMASSSGEKVILNTLQQNSETVKRMLT